MGCACDKALVTTKVHGVIDVKVGGTQGRGISCPQLTPTQKAVIRNTWQTLKLQIANVGVTTFTGLFESNPELVETFSSLRGKELGELRVTGLLRSHALRVMSVIDTCVDNLDDTGAMSTTLGHIGRLHKQNNVTSALVKTILPHFLEAIKPHIEDYWSKELRQAWEMLFDTMLFYMRPEMDKVSPVKMSAANSLQDTS